MHRAGKKIFLEIFFKNPTFWMIPHSQNTLMLKSATDLFVDNNFCNSAN